MTAGSTLAITGATGFVGKRLVDLALAAGFRVRALARRPQEPREGIDWVYAALDNDEALRRLTTGSEAVIHVAGVVNVPTRAAFRMGNIDGTRRIVAAAEAAGVRRFVHVSSLAAREPRLSDYGWSKAGAEEIVAASDRDWTIVRPPAVYGPGDMEMRDMFRMAQWGLALLPPPGRLSAIHVDDLARLLLALAQAPGRRETYEPEDAGGGMSHDAFARAIGAAVGRRVLPLPLPRSLLSLAARADRRLRGSGAKLTADRVAYMCHPDWTADAERRPPAGLWQPSVPLAQGLAETARWYRAHGLL